MSYIDLKETDRRGIDRGEVFEWFLDHNCLAKDDTQYIQDYKDYILHKDKDPKWHILKTVYTESRWLVGIEPRGEDLLHKFLDRHNKVNLDNLKPGGWIELRCGSVYEVEDVDYGNICTVTTYKNRESLHRDTCECRRWNHKRDGTWHGETNSAGDIVKIHPPGAYVSKRINVEPSFLQEDPVDTINHFEYVDRYVEIHGNIYVIKGLSQDYDEDVVLTLEDINTNRISYHLIPSKSELEFKLHMKKILRENMAHFFGQKALETIKDSNQETKPDIKTDNVKSAVEDVIKTILNL